VAEPSSFPVFTNITTNDASLVNKAFALIWANMQTGTFIWNGLIPGTNNTVRRISHNNGQSILMETLVGTTWTATGIEWDIGNNIPSVPGTNYLITNVYVNPGNLHLIVQYNNGTTIASLDINPAGGGGSVPTGTGFYHVTSGVMDAAATSVSSGNITALQALSGTNTGDETASSIESKLSVSAGNITALSNLSGTNTGDQTLPTGGTPALTLSTSNAAGSSGHYVRDDDTILVFDATVPVTQAFGDSAATGSAGTAARRDHKHGMPAAPTLSGLGGLTRQQIMAVTG